MGYWKVILAFFICAVVVGQDNTKKEILTRYLISGRVANQAQDAKGMHEVLGSVTLSSSTATVTLNTSTAEGKQDISFRDSTTYTGQVFSMNPNDTAIYRVVAVSGKQFTIKVLRASDWSNTATVKYVLRGE